MDDDRFDDPPGSDLGSPRPRPADEGEVEPDLGLEEDPWADMGARRGPRQAAEGVRIIGADEAAAAIESGHVTARKPEDELRFGDVPPPPAGPRPSLRFPGDDPAAVDKPPVVEPAETERESAAAEAARRWDEALARSSEGRTRGRSASALFGDPDDDRDDPFGVRRSTGAGASFGPGRAGP
ncbi:MAG TPA: hypothetical protein VM390_11140, partial [Acidimicrobiales bacterium]|nr:hypothetical protein [Acidimicrobiales bacterium]